MRLVVFAPNYANCSAGIRACFRLVEAAQKLGMPSRVHIAGTEGTASPDEVVVYPEIYSGNPLNASHVVRWLLGPQKFEPAEDELVYAWPGSSPPTVPRLCVNVIELELFKPKAVAGHAIVGWVGKGVPNADFSPEWIGYGTPSTRAGLAAVLSDAALLVSCDSFSALNLEATMVGTPVRLYGGMPPGSLFPEMGIACTDDEMPEAAAALRGGTAYQAFRDVTLPEIADDVPRFLAACESAFFYRSAA